MNADQKQRANELLSVWRATAYALHGDRMADLLQELVDAPDVLQTMQPSKEQLTQILNELDKCFAAESKREFLRVWIRDWTAHKLALAFTELRQPTPSVCYPLSSNNPSTPHDTSYTTGTERLP